MPSILSPNRPDRSHSTTEARERRKHKSSRSRRKVEKGEDEAEEEIDEPAILERSSTDGSSIRRRRSMPIPELNRRGDSTSPSSSKVSLPYPTFSKAHSREAVRSTENVATHRGPLTPDPTDLPERKKSRSRNDRTEHDEGGSNRKINGPPSPPLTAVDQPALEEESQRTSPKSRKKAPVGDGSNSGESKVRVVSSSSARSSPVKRSRDDPERLTTPPTVRRSKTSTPAKTKLKHVTVVDASSTASAPRSRSSSPTSLKKKPGTTTATSSTVDSDTTSIAPKQPSRQQPFTPDVEDDTSPNTASDSSPRTPTPRGTPFPESRKQTPAYDVPSANVFGLQTGESPMPPPPPPPPAVPFSVQRVDYLMQNGGLSQCIPKQFLTAPDPARPVQHTLGELPNPTQMAAQVQKFFTPFTQILDSYSKVMEKSGSVAVATGYRSIARRLLDRLEAVFARDISSETCTCMICEETNDDHRLEDERGISWGEILEYVCGRRELPPWPPFTLNEAPVGLGISAGEFRAPMQRLDIDIPEEYREHYIRQSRKTKQSVDRWLAGQMDDAAPPEEADDDTLTFAILTHLEPDQRPIFRSILGVASSRPASVTPSRSATPLNAPRSPLLQNAGLAIQRLYRLINVPRSPEIAMYLVNNPHLHNVLATLAAVSDAEWEILTSGRFDGFLRSGAEDHTATSLPPSRSTSAAYNRPGTGGFSRNPTPAPRSSTPGPTGSASAPVALDEDTEIATLAEVEREIYLGMEALEDAFEALHLKAETVRQLLRSRSAGLSMAAQARRGGFPNDLEARLGTPASQAGSVGVAGVNGRWESETDDGINDDGMSELAPDDSASNVSSSNRHRRPKRRSERIKTPAAVEEESEEDDGGGGGARRVSWSRNSFRRR